jgi:hypothetical protein
MHASLDTIADVIPLTSAEKGRLAELEGIVETHLEAFLATGRALTEIRNKRLYRQDFATWEDYCVRRWGLSYSRANELARSAQIADHLLSNCAGPQGDAPLPADLSADVLKPLGKLDPPLQSAVWRLASRVTEHPTQHVVSKITQVVQEAINQGANGNGASKPKPKPPQSQKKVFLLSLHRLSDNPWFSPHLVVQGLDEAKARKHLRAAQALLSRLHELIGELRREFPEL